MYTLCRKVFQWIVVTLMQEYKTGGHDVTKQVKWNFQKSRVGCLGNVSSRVFDSDYIWCSCEIVKCVGDMEHVSLNTSYIFGICMCYVSSIYDITVTTASTEIPREEIDRRFWIFGVYLVCFLGGLSVYWWGLISNILVGTW